MNSNERAALDAAVRAAGLDARIDSARELAGGCIHRVYALELTDGQRLVAKVNDAGGLGQFHEESHGLRALAATRTVIVPRPLTVIEANGLAVLVMTHIHAIASHEHERRWERFGADLAALHSAPIAPHLSHGYGFDIANHIGMTAQPNGWSANWVEFNAAHRLGHQLRLARSVARLDADEARRIETVIARLDHLLPSHPRPSLLHGDLWSGNIICCRSPDSGDTCAVIDPAPSVGDALADIAMMRLFGGIDGRCFDAWGERLQVDLENAELATRLAVYQLYHVLNHVNIFGRAYAAQAMSLARRLA